MTHNHCLQCLGFQHAEDAFVDDSCACCGRMSMISLRSRLSFMKGFSFFLYEGLAFPFSWSLCEQCGWRDLGDLRVKVRASPPGMPPQTAYVGHPVRFPGDFAGLSHEMPSISFGAPQHRGMGSRPLGMKGPSLAQPTNTCN